MGRRKTKEQDIVVEVRKKKKASRLRISIIVASAIMCATAMGFFLKIVITGEDPYNRLVSNLGTMFLIALPFLTELIARKRFSDFVLTFYFVYIFFAGFLGNVFLLYQFVPYYDKVMHTIFGYVGCVCGLFALCKLTDAKLLKPFFIGLSCFAFSMMCGAIWEVIEYCSDLFLGQNAQGVPVETVGGGTVVSLADTMGDLVANMIGALLFVGHYALSRLIKKNLLMESMIRDFGEKN